MSSSAPGASPTNIRSAFGLPTPNTTCVRPERVQLAARAVADVRADGDERLRGGRHRQTRDVNSSRNAWRADLRLGRHARTASARSRSSSDAAARRVLAAPAPLRVAADAGHAELLHRTGDVLRSRGGSTGWCGQRGTRARSCSARSRITAANAVFGPVGSASSPSRADERGGVEVRVEAGVLSARRRWRRSGRRALRAQLRAAARDADRRSRPRSRRAPACSRRACAAPELGEDVRRPHERERQRAVGLLDLACRAAALGRVVGDGRRHDHDVRVAGARPSPPRASPARVARVTTSTPAGTGSSRRTRQRASPARRGAPPRRRSRSPSSRWTGCRCSEPRSMSS